MVRKFFYVCAGLFLLVLTYRLGPRIAWATPGTVGTAEVATGQGYLTNGQPIPLPVYADGTTALEAECSWIVNAAVRSNGAAAPAWCYSADALYSGYQSSAFLNSHRGRVVNLGWVNGDDPYYPSSVSYIIVAVRQSLPTPAARASWGEVKARFAPNNGPKNQTPTNR
jgi:hypothetical protein